MMIGGLGTKSIPLFNIVYSLALREFWWVLLPR